NMAPWYAEAVRQAQAAYGLPVKFRPHPRAVAKGYQQRPSNAEPSTGSLAEALADAHVAVTWNSNSAVDAVLAGVPTVAVDAGSMAWDVAAHSIGTIVRPDRSNWMVRLAWSQWSLDEIASGAALRGLLAMKEAHGN